MDIERIENTIKSNDLSRGQTGYLISCDQTTQIHPAIDKAAVMKTDFGLVVLSGTLAGQALQDPYKIRPATFKLVQAT